MADDELSVERRDGVAWLVLNRPARLNALSPTLIVALSAAIAKVSNDDDVRCIVLTGAGRGFCAGEDLSALDAHYEAGGQPAQTAVAQQVYRSLVPPLVEAPKPTLAAVNGAAAGAGLSLALACDLRIASTDAKFAQAFLRVGLVPDLGSTWLLPRVVGYAKALEWTLSGETLDAAGALRLGLVGRVVAAEAFHAEIKATAARLAALPTGAVAATKRLYRRALDIELSEALDREAQAQAQMAATDDHREGVRAFLEKRPPRFAGR